MNVKKAFSLIELLVVIGIIAILTGVLIGTFGRASESAMSAVCLTNMKNLAMAVRSYGSVPPAISHEYPYVTSARGGHFEHTYMEKRGWISWYSEGLYNETNPDDWRANSTQQASCHHVGMYSPNPEEAQYALSHGALFKHLSGNVTCYVCPLHKRIHPTANWSYLLRFVGWADKDHTGVVEEKFGRGDERKLLFAEVPFRSGSPGDWFPTDNEATEETDAALQLYGDKPENIGANHKIGKDWVAHIAYIDGHVEKLRIGRSMSPDDLRELSRMLADIDADGHVGNGKDLSYNPKAKKYEEVK